MKLSIIVPVFNEEKTLVQILDEILNLQLYDNDNSKIQKEIIVINDGSKDSSSEIIDSYAKKKMIIGINKSKNQGKGAAVRDGFKKCTGDIILIQDADLEYNPQEYPRLIKPILDKKTHVVFGNRFIGKSNKKKKWGIPLHYIGNKFLSFAFTCLFLTRVGDMETCYKCFTRKVLTNIRLKENDFKIEPEITTQIIKNGFKIKEVPITYNYRKFEEGKKITWKDGIKALFVMFKYRIQK
jgi:glycosyltransferase involved in cell wall biosynthesis